MVALVAAAASQPCGVLKNISAFLIDLDGTMYKPGGLIPGAQQFVQWLEKTSKPFVFLSNSGAKGVKGVQAKFMTPPYKLQDKPISLNQAYTGASAVAHWLVDHVPPYSRLFIIQGMAKYGATTDSFVRVMHDIVPPNLLATWTWRTDLDDATTEMWAADLHFKRHNSTFVVLSNDGQIHDIDGDPVTHKAGYTDWSYSLLSHAQQLLENGAPLINQAPDPAPWPLRKNGVVLDTPGPGPFVSLLKAAIYPKGLNSSYTCGKGGNVGNEYMYAQGLRRLREQGFNGGLHNVAMVGDVLSTDIKGGQSFGVRTFLVLSGCGTVAQEPFYPGIVPDCVFSGLGEIPNAAGAASPSRAP